MVRGGIRIAVALVLVSLLDVGPATASPAPAVTAAAPAAQEDPDDACGNELKTAWNQLHWAEPAMDENLSSICGALASGDVDGANESAAYLFRLHMGSSGLGYSDARADLALRLFKNCLSSVPQGGSADANPLARISGCSQGVETTMGLGWADNLANSLVDVASQRGLGPLQASALGEQLQSCLDDQLGQRRASIQDIRDACLLTLRTIINPWFGLAAQVACLHDVFRSGFVLAEALTVDELAASVPLAQSSGSPEDPITMCQAESSAQPAPPAVSPAVSGAVWKLSSVETNPTHLPSDLRAARLDPELQWRDLSTSSITWTWDSPSHNYTATFGFTPPPDQLVAGQPITLTVSGKWTVTKDDGAGLNVGAGYRYSQSDFSADPPDFGIYGSPHDGAVVGRSSRTGSVTPSSSVTGQLTPRADAGDTIKLSVVSLAGMQMWVATYTR